MKKDEDVPQLIEAEPQVEGVVKKTVGTALKPVKSLFKDSDGDGIADEDIQMTTTMGFLMN